MADDNEILTEIMGHPYADWQALLETLREHYDVRSPAEGTIVVRRQNEMVADAAEALGRRLPLAMLRLKKCNARQAERIASLEAEVERLREQLRQQMELTETMRVAARELMVERDGARLLIDGILEEARDIEANCREDWLEEGQAEIEKAAAAADLDFAIVYRERLEGMVRNTKHPEADGLHNNKEN